ncbi:hypothetical protein F4805DRAFT_54137 [Annulohypoxylon moriforme]|nr:hypothetical protein F4805DRAFT_54137 [Annulohypoxylon moriforme]
MSTHDLHGAQALTMASLKGILRKPSIGDERAAFLPPPRKNSVSFGDVLARDVEGGQVVHPSARSRDEWMREVNRRRGANLIEMFRDSEGARACRVSLVESVGDGDGVGKEVVLYELASDSEEESGEESEDDDGDDESESEDEVEDEGEDDGADKIEVIFESDSEDGDDDDDNNDDDNHSDNHDDGDKKEETKGEKDSMEYARTLLQSEIGK